jgi:hypothetical protein
MNRPPNEELDRLDGTGDLKEFLHCGFRIGVRSRLGKLSSCCKDILFVDSASNDL